MVQGRRLRRWYESKESLELPPVDTNVILLTSASPSDIDTLPVPRATFSFLSSSTPLTSAALGQHSLLATPVQ